MVISPLFIYHPDGTRTANYNDTQLNSLLSNLEPYCYVDHEDDLHAPVDDYVITAIDVLDYIYGVLHSPRYRATYKEFLKIDFPRVPKPESVEQFAHFAEAGTKLRELHLMKSITPGNYMLRGEGGGTVEKITFVADATGSVEQPENTTGSVYINATQYFANIPETAWNFYIGGYQPAQKWLKDRKGRPLGYKDIEHYQRIITILLETDKIIKEIDKLQVK